MLNTKEYETCKNILSLLTEHSYSWPFLEPVDPIALNLPTYFDEIKNPMDLKTILNKLVANQYESPDQFFDDILLMYDNAIKFNKDHESQESVGYMAIKLRELATKYYNKYFNKDSMNVSDKDLIFLNKMNDIAAQLKLNERWQSQSFVARKNREKAIHSNHIAMKI